ncbi:hypothetical protein ALP75_202343 [Pseudomonas syringae pv. actinidiae]|nr:hypothetical protein ALP75_202343 [Pseudomonas syringae pv. actinidiae]
MVAILATVLDDTHPRLTGLERGPHMLEHRWRHVRVAHCVVRGTEQFRLAVTADIDESIVAVRDGATGVGGGDQSLFGRKCPLALSDGLVVAHGISILRSGRRWRVIGRGVDKLSIARQMTGKSAHQESVAACLTLRQFLRTGHCAPECADGSGSDQLAQHIMQNAAGLEVLHLIERVDAAQQVDRFLAAVLAVDVQGQAHARLHVGVGQAGDF